MWSEGGGTWKLPDVEHIGGPGSPCTYATSVISISFHGEKAFVPPYGIVHHGGTKRLNQVAWSESPWGFSAIQRPQIIHSQFLSFTRPHCDIPPFTSPFSPCKTIRALHDAGEKIAESIERLCQAPSGETPLENCEVNFFPLCVMLSISHKVRCLSGKPAFW